MHDGATEDDVRSPPGVQFGGRTLQRAILDDGARNMGEHCKVQSDIVAERAMDLATEPKTQR